MHFLGIDIGTSAVKAVLVDEHQRIVAEAAARTPISQPRPGWFEQDPDALWRATERVVAELRASDAAAFSDVRGIGLSGQMHGAVILDEAERPIRPAILWNDSRATAECAELSADVPEIARIAGVVPMPGFTAPKLLWLRRHEPASFARTRRILLAKDYVRLRLTGEIATDMCDAAGTLMLDERRRDWADTVLAAVGIDRTQLPALLEGNAPSGRLRRELAEAWGIAGPVVVAAGAGDAAAGAVGIGAVEAGDGFISLGTSAQIFFCRKDYRPKPETLIHAFAHALPDRWFEMAALLNGASCLDWIGSVTGREPAALLADAERSNPRPSPVLFLPYLAGERTPHNDPGARGVFANLDHATGPGDLAQALLEGVAFALRDGFNAFGQTVEAESILPIVGGGSRSGHWVRTIATVLGRRLARVAGGEYGPAYGAARLGRLAVTGEDSSDVCTKPKPGEIVEPDERLADRYSRRYDDFRRLYRSLRRVREATEDRRRGATR
jgi:xylulokinase